jgi:hypothetical protein
MKINNIGDMNLLLLLLIINKELNWIIIIIVSRGHAVA